MTARRRVLILIPSYLPIVGGAEVAVAALAERMTQFEFVVITGRLRRDLPRFERVGAVDVHRIGPGTRYDAWLLPFLAPLTALRLGRFSLVHCMGANQGAAAGFVLTLLRPRTPMLLSLVGTADDQRAASRRLGPLYRAIHRRSKMIHAITSWHADRARASGYAGPIATIPYGADLERFRPGSRDDARMKIGLPDGAFVLATTARLVPRKRIADLVRAMALLSSDVHSVVAGTGPERASLEKLAHTLHLSGRLRLLGRVDDADLPSVLQAADAFVLPSSSEGFGIATVEAMACGLPVVVTPVDGVVDLVDDGRTGLWCEPFNPASIAEQVSRLRADPALRDRLAATARREVVERYDWTRVADAFGALYDDVIGSASRPTAAA